MNREGFSSNREIKLKAKESLKGNWGIAIVSCIIYGILLKGFSTTINMREFINEVFMENVSNGDVDIRITIISILITVFLSGAMTYGLTSFFIKLVRKENPDVGDVFSGFKHYKGTLIINILLLVYEILWSLMFIVPVAIILIISVASVEAENISTLAMLFMILVLIIVFMVLAIILFRYSMSFYIYFDNPELTASQVIKKSIDMMEGNQFRLFKLYLSFILWFLLAIFTFGLAMIWITPYMQAATAVFYEDLNDKGFNNTDINNIF